MTRMTKTEFSLWVIVLTGLVFSLFVLLYQVNHMTNLAGSIQLEADMYKKHVELLREQLANPPRAIIRQCDFDCGSRDFLTECQKCLKELSLVDDRISIKANK